MLVGITHKEAPGLAADAGIQGNQGAAGSAPFRSLQGSVLLIEIGGFQQDLPITEVRHLGHGARPAASGLLVIQKLNSQITSHGPQGGDDHPGLIQPIEAILLGPMVHTAAHHLEAKAIAVKAQAGFRIADPNRRVIDAHRQSGGRWLGMPAGMALVGWKLEQFQRVAQRVGELHRFNPGRAFIPSGQGLNRAGNRLGIALQRPRIATVQVMGDHADVLEPAIVAARIGRNWCHQRRSAIRSRSPVPLPQLQLLAAQAEDGSRNPKLRGAAKQPTDPRAFEQIARLLLKTQVVAIPSNLSIKIGTGLNDR